MTLQQALHELIRGFFKKTFLQRATAHGLHPGSKVFGEAPAAQQSLHALLSAGFGQQRRGQATGRGGNPRLGQRLLAAEPLLFVAFDRVAIHLAEGLQPGQCRGVVERAAGQRRNRAHKHAGPEIDPLPSWQGLAGRTDVRAVFAECLKRRHGRVVTRHRRGDTCHTLPDA